jgi:signal transduction histidine kinase/CheY-like chemotaxis protein
MPRTTAADLTPTADLGPYRSEEHFRLLLEALPAGAYTCDTDGLITYYNRRAVELWGREPKLNDRIDRFCGSFKLYAIDGAPITHDRCWMALALQTGRGFNRQEVIVERPDGQRLTALAHANPIRDDAGRLIGAVNVLVDISDIKRAETELREADRRKDEFLATLAHELRNPLAPIQNAVHILRTQGPLDPALQWARDVIDRQVRQMTRLVDDLLDLSRISTGKLNLRTAEITLVDVLHTAVEISRPVIESSGHRLTVTEPTEPVTVDGDLTRLAQVVANLLNNAAKYTPRDGRIDLAAERQGSDAVITVRDSGIGIPSHMLTRIFEMFTQADGAPERAPGGLGIGLTLCQRLVDLHGGSIAARSAGLGQGSEFVVRLPAVLTPTKPRRPVDGGDNPAVPARSLRILVVDDNRDAAATLAMLLRIMGHDVRTAHDGAEAVALAADARPDAVLLDIGLPKLNGFEAARRIREQPGGAEVVLLATTGWGQETDRRRSREAGFDHHLVKPVDPAVLMKLLADISQALPAPGVAGR